MALATLSRRGMLLGCLLAGCGGETGMLIIVHGDGAALTALEFRIARDRCGRWEQEETPPKATADVRGRDLRASPYRLLVLPAPGDAAAALVVLVSGRTAGGTVAFGASGPFVFQPGQRRSIDVTLEPVDPPSWSTDDGCFCPVAAPWLAVDRASCSTAIPVDPRPSLTDACGPRPAEPPTQCDGVAGNHETAGRFLPCYLESAKRCLVGTRRCADQASIAYDEACESAIALPAPARDETSACAAFAVCDQACVDPVACMVIGRIAPRREHCLESGDGRRIVGLGSLGEVAALPYGPDVPGEDVKVALVDEQGGRRMIARAPLQLEVTEGASEGTSFDVPLLVDHRLVIIQVTIAATCGSKPMPDLGVEDTGLPPHGLDLGVPTDLKLSYPGDGA